MVCEKLKNGIPTRYAVAIVCFLNLAYVQMIHLNSAHVLKVMVDTTIQESNTTYSFDNDTASFNATDVEMREKRVKWKDYMRFVIPSSYVFGYVVTQIPAGRLAEWIGTKYLFAAMQVTSGLLTAFSPALAQAGLEFFIMARITLGTAQGAMLPSMQPLIIKWAPMTERTTIATLIHSGCLMGMILSIVTRVSFVGALGWKGALIVEALLMVLVVTSWLACVFNSPRLHPRISHDEKLYIESSAATLERQRSAVPWRKIFKSLPCWALFIASVGYNWGFYILFAQLPVYLNTVLYQGTDLENTVTFVLPWLFMWITSIAVSVLSDVCVQRSYWTVAKARKFTNSVGFLGPAVILTMLATIECDRWWALILFSFAAAMLGGVYSGVLVNHLDLTQNFAATMFGLFHGVSTIVVWTAALIIGERSQTFVRWQVSFFITAGILVTSAIIFIFFGSTELQDWDRAVPKQRSISDRMSQHLEQPLLRPTP